MLDLAYLARLEWLVHSARRLTETEYEAMQRAANGAAAIAEATPRKREAGKDASAPAGQVSLRSP